MPEDAHVSSPRSAALIMIDVRLMETIIVILDARSWHSVARDRLLDFEFAFPDLNPRPEEPDERCLNGTRGPGYPRRIVHLRCP